MPKVGPAQGDQMTPNNPPRKIESKFDFSSRFHFKLVELVLLETRTHKRRTCLFDNETNFKALIVQAQAGDAKAYKELLNQLMMFLMNYLKRRIFETNDIEEVIQEILLALHKSMHTYDSKKSFMGWFMSIVEYKITDYIRFQQKMKANVDIEVLSKVFDTRLTDSDLRLDLEKAIASLNSKEKTILTELKVKGFSVSEVAKALNLSEANVKVIAHRAYLNLQKLLGAIS